ncbi:hypothetical protein TWF281_007515 [Arthrobotrys megalospora]
MRISIIGNLLAFASIVAPALCVPLADSGVDKSPSLGHQLFPRDEICTCCRPASTITLSSTKLFVTKTTETVYTTSTQTKPVTVLATATATPVATVFTTVTTVYSTTSVLEPVQGGTTTTTSWETIWVTSQDIITATVTPPSVTQTTYALIGGVKFWKRDNALVARGPQITATDCPCVNVECMTAVATTEKVTITSFSTVLITKPAETGVLVFTTFTKWKTTTLKLTLTTLAVETVTHTAIALPTGEASTVYDETVTETYTTTIFEVLEPVTTSITAPASGTLTTVSFTQVAYFPSATMVIGRGDAPASDGQTEAYAVDLCASWCAKKPECLDWSIRSDNGWPFGTRNPPTKYCVWFDASNRFDTSNMTPFLQGGLPWVTDTAVWKRIE